MEVRIIQFEPHGDDRGQLVALEEMKNIPFKIRRVYFMYDTVGGVTRGRHAHKSLEQVLICIHGSCRILLDDGKERETEQQSQNQTGSFSQGHEAIPFRKEIRRYKQKQLLLYVRMI